MYRRTAATAWNISKTCWITPKYLLGKNSAKLLYRGCTNSQMASDIDIGMAQSVDGILTAAQASQAERKSKEFCTTYCKLDLDQREHFLQTLAKQYGVDHEDIVKQAQMVVDGSNREKAFLVKAEERLSQSLVAAYTKLFKKVALIEGGVKFLVDFRADILNTVVKKTDARDETQVPLKSMNGALRELLSLWFSVGFLQLERITWKSSCEMLQKISQYEAVHPMRHWTDLKRRVGPYRRCFVFTHDSMPGEPIVVLHTALTRQISSSIQAIVSQQRLSRMQSAADYSSLCHRDVVEDSDKVTTAMFYSITSTQKGLQGIELGNYLIKKVSDGLRTEFPNMSQFCSLSPIPGFREWLITDINKQLTGRTHHKLLHDQENEMLEEIIGNDQPVLLKLKNLLSENFSLDNTELINTLKEPLMRMCARYLYLEKHRGYALNSVANFHLKNGATLWRINWLADKSLRGAKSSCGMMVNYRYFLENSVEISQQYVEKQIITSSQQIHQLISSLPQSKM